MRLTGNRLRASFRSQRVEDNSWSIVSIVDIVEDAEDKDDDKTHQMDAKPPDLNKVRWGFPKCQQQRATVASVRAAGTTRLLPDHQAHYTLHTTTPSLLPRYAAIATFLLAFLTHVQ
uniref:Uncharacterized protein n=1 Tax=Talaromyces marneffei PM1 TaxID=1077442 RepID=A0A093XQL9_TALMA